MAPEVEASFPVLEQKLRRETSDGRLTTAGNHSFPTVNVTHCGEVAKHDPGIVSHTVLLATPNLCE